MGVQTSYTMVPGIGLAGQPVDSELINVQSYITPDDTVPFGRAVVLDTSPDKCKNPDAAGQIILGISRLSQAQEAQPDGTMEYQPGQTVGVITKGRVWCLVDQDVAFGDPVFYRHTGTAADIGKFRKDADTANASQIAQARFESTATAGTLAIVAINLP